MSDSESPQISKILPSILTDLDSVVVWMVSIRPLISKSSSLFYNLSVTVRRAKIIIGINITFMFHGYFELSSKIQVFIRLFLFISILLCGQPEQQSPQVCKFSLLFFIMVRPGRLARIIIIIYLFRVFHVSISRWFFPGVWVTASLLKSPGLFSVSCPFSVLLLLLLLLLLHANS